LEFAPVRGELQPLSPKTDFGGRPVLRASLVMISEFMRQSLTPGITRQSQVTRLTVSMGYADANPSYDGARFSGVLPVNQEGKISHENC